MLFFSSCFSYLICALSIVIFFSFRLFVIRYVNVVRRNTASTEIQPAHTQCFFVVVLIFLLEWFLIVFDLRLRAVKHTQMCEISMYSVSTHFHTQTFTHYSCSITQFSLSKGNFL